MYTHSVLEALSIGWAIHLRAHSAQLARLLLQAPLHVQHASMESTAQQRPHPAWTVQHGHAQMVNTARYVGCTCGPYM
jgi:hypothetical protein